MRFPRYANAVILKSELEKGDDAIGHELGGGRPRNKARPFFSTHREILLELRDADFVPVSLRLDGNDVLNAKPIDRRVQLVDLDLTDVVHERPQMALKRIRRHAEKHVDEPVVAHKGKQSLFVALSARRDDLGRGIGHFSDDKILFGLMRTASTSSKAYAAFPLPRITHSLPSGASPTTDCGSFER